MHLLELLQRHGKLAVNSVPDWLLGCFKRRSITFANGLIDTQTHVFWLQSRNITIDLRLPVETEQVGAKPLEQYDEQELRTLANYEGWYAESVWQNDTLNWSGGTSFQIHNRWPEPASLTRVGDCMMEFCPSSSYIEDWRILSREPGPLVGLRLIAEEELDTGRLRHRSGALIINGGWAGLVLGRVTDIRADADSQDLGRQQLRDRVCAQGCGAAFLQDVFNFETSVACGDLASGFSVSQSTRPGRVACTLFPLDGFEFDDTANEVIHIFDDGNTRLKRRFSIDTLEADFPFSGDTSLTQPAAQWFDFEHETLGRYLKVWNH
ncbi:MAG: hypothetical protein R3E64_03325 [Halioglobus sp.]